MSSKFLTGATYWSPKGDPDDVEGGVGKSFGLKGNEDEKIEIRDCKERHLKITKLTSKFPLQTRKSSRLH